MHSWRTRRSLARLELENWPIAGVAADELHEGAGGACDLAAATCLQLDVVHDRADRDRAERHGIARLHVDSAAGDDFVADVKALRREDVGELAVGVLDERDEGRPVRIVLEPLDRAATSNLRRRKSTRRYDCL
jgi:hypothetical protein